MKNVWTTAFVATALAAAAGCKKDGEAGAAGGGKAVTCEAAIDKMIECGGERSAKLKEKRAEVMKECEEEVAKGDKRDLESVGKCIDKSCADFEGCVKEANKAARRDKDMAKIKEATEKGEFEGVSWTCEEAVKDNKDQEMVTACKALTTKAVTTLTETVTKFRDEGTKDEKYICSDLERFAKQVSEDEEKKAKALCEDLRTSEDVKKVLDETKKLATEEAGKVKLPWECKSTYEDLKKSTSEWGKTKAKDVLDACYTNLAKVVVTKLRDAGAGDPGFICFDVEKLAAFVSPEEETWAKLACQEVKVAKEFTQVREEVKKAIAEATADGSKAQVPFQCDFAIEQAEKDIAGSEWGKAQIAEVAKACYVELGKVVLEKKTADMKYGCDFNVQKVVDGAKKHQLTDPALDPLLAHENVKAHCIKAQ